MASGASSPLISIVVPTRDRPEFAALAVKALSKQSFRDFEVILSDNALRRPFVPDPGLFDGVQIRYVRPPKPVWMTDHWEFAVAQARGQYVGVLGDKSMLVPTALEQVAAEIRREGPDVVSWRVAAFQPAGRAIAGPGVVAVIRAANEEPIKVPAAEVLRYLLSTYLDPHFAPDHHLEIRGSVYHGVFSATLLQAMKARFGRIFRFYAPDLNAQCAAMQIARTVSYLGRPLELIIEGPSNGIAVGWQVSRLLGTQEEAAQGASGASPKLIPGLSASIAHLLASDLVAIAGHTLSREQVEEAHMKAAFDLHRAADWPSRAFHRSQLEALAISAAPLGPGFLARLRRQKWRARHRQVRAAVSTKLRSRFGRGVDAFLDLVRRERSPFERHSFEHLFAALDGTT